MAWFVPTDEIKRPLTLSKAILLFPFLWNAGIVPPSLVKTAPARRRESTGLSKPHHSCGQFNGAVVIAGGGCVIQRRGEGFAEMEWRIPREPNSKFPMGFIKKQFTAMLVLQLVQDGRLKLEWPAPFQVDLNLGLGSVATGDTDESLAGDHLLLTIPFVPNPGNRPRIRGKSLEEIPVLRGRL